MANKKITEEEINAICENLVGTKSSNRRSAASIENQIKQSYGIPPKTIADIPDDAMMNIDLF